MNSNLGLDRLSLPLLLISLPITVMSVLLPMYTSALGLNALQVTGLFSVFSFILVIMRLFIGRITDRIGRKPVFISGLLFYALSYFIYTIGRTISLIYIGRSLQAIAAASVNISIYSMIADLNIKGNAHSFGKINGYYDKGGLLGIILCFFVLYTPSLVDGWSRLFAICTFLAILSITYSLIFLHETKPLSRNISKVSLNDNKNLLRIFSLIFSIFTSTVSAIFVLYLQSRFNSDLLEIGIAFLFPNLILAFASPRLGRISDNIGSKKVFSVSLIMLIISMFALPFMDNIYLFGAIWTIYIIAITLLDVTLMGVYVEDLKEEIRGAAIGKLTMASNIGSIIGPVIGGLAFQIINIKAPFIISTIGFVLMLIMIIYYGRHQFN